MGCALLLAQLMPFAGIGVTTPIAYLSELTRSGRLIPWLAYTTTFFTVALVCARPRTHELVILAATAVVACVLHASLELTVHPDVFGLVMVALLSAFWPTDASLPSHADQSARARQTPDP